MSWKGYGIVGKRGSAEGVSPLPEREVSSLLLLFFSAAGGKKR
jgi:hypothetical protein